MYICVAQRTGKIHIVDFKVGTGDYFCVCGERLSSLKNKINVFSSEAMDSFCKICTLYINESKFLDNHFKSNNLYKLNRILKDNKYISIRKRSSSLFFKLVNLGTKKR